MIIKPIPILDSTIWGNNTLNQLIYQCDENKGTHWLISFHEYGTNRVVGSEQTLADLLRQMGRNLVGDDCLLRLAYLDAKNRLSIQCHPSDAYAKQSGLNDLGKYEAWLILKAKPGAQLALGVMVDSPVLLNKHIENATLESVIRMVEVQANDFVYIPAGCLHALGDGIVALEVSTNSNTTYRAYDYNRIDEQGRGRKLHRQQVTECVCLDYFPQLKQAVFTENVSVLFDGEYFQILTVGVKTTLSFNTRGHAWYGVCLDSVSVNGVLMKAYEPFLVAAQCGLVEFKGEARIVLSRGK